MLQRSLYACAHSPRCAAGTCPCVHKRSKCWTCLINSTCACIRTHPSASQGRAARRHLHASWSQQIARFHSRTTARLSAAKMVGTSPGCLHATYWEHEQTLPVEMTRGCVQVHVYFTNTFRDSPKSATVAHVAGVSSNITNRGRPRYPAW